MNSFENSIYRRKISLLEACKEFNIPVEDAPLNTLETCSSCSIWYKSSELVLDLDSNPICKVCKRFYGL
jgi:hypothetical protein